MFLEIQSFVSGISDMHWRGRYVFSIRKKYKLLFNHNLKPLLDRYSLRPKNKKTKILCQNIVTVFLEAQKYIFYITKNTNF